MAVKCVQCGGPCSDIGGGEYECQFCGATFSKAELNPAFAKQATPVASAADSGADVFDKNISGVLEISAVGKKSSWSGSGYLFSNSGYAITNAHVAADDVDGRPAQKMAVRVCNQTVPATVVALADDKAGSGSGVDLAIIKLAQMPMGARALTLEEPDKLRNGESVFVIGNSLGQGTCITSGIISDKARRSDGLDYIMTDCAVNGGNSGGPIFNQSGNVIGTITLQGRTRTGADAEGMNYAIPIKTVKAFIEQVQRQAGIRF